MKKDRILKFTTIIKSTGTTLVQQALVYLNLHWFKLRSKIG
mgnify:FL=1|jgi:hypothetical protein